MSRVGKLAVGLALVLAVTVVFGAAALAQGAATVQVAQSASLGNVLVDGKGMTLYLFTNDKPGVSNCTGGCLVAWPPLTVTQASQITAGPGVTAKLASITRPDGALQVTANDMPLYYWAKDKAAGDVTGQGVGKVWYVLDPAGTMVTTALPAQAATAGPTAAAGATAAPGATAVPAATAAVTAPTTAPTAAAGAATAVPQPSNMPTTGGSGDWLWPLAALALILAAGGFGLRLARRTNR